MGIMMDWDIWMDIYGKKFDSRGLKVELLENLFKNGFWG